MCQPVGITWLDHLELGVVDEALHFLQCRKLLRRVVEHLPNRYQCCKDIFRLGRHLAAETQQSWRICALQCTNNARGANVRIRIWTPFFVPEKVAAPSYPCPLSFPASMSLSTRKAFSAANIEAASQAERLTSPRKCSTGEPELSTHLKQIESSSIVAISVDSSTSIE